MRALSVCLAGLPVEVHVSPLDLVDAPAVLADPALLTRCLGLLVRRALVRGTGDEIGWDWSVEGDRVRLVMHRAADAGVEPEEFLRATPRTSDARAAGSGLEGALARGLAVLLGGTVSVDERERRLLVELRLPVAG